MSTLKEMDLGIEAWVIGIAVAALLAIAAVGPKSNAGLASAQPPAQFRTHLDFSVTPGNPARLRAIQPAFGISKQA